MFVTGLGVWSTDYPTTHVTSAGVGLIDYPDKAYSDNPLRYALTLESSAENAKAFSAPAGHIAIAMKSGTEIKLGNSLFCFNMGELKSNLIRAPRQQAADWSVVPEGLTTITPVMAFTAGTTQGPLALKPAATFTIRTSAKPAKGQQAYLVYGDVVDGRLTVAGFKAMTQARPADYNSYSCELASIYPCNMLVFAAEGAVDPEDEIDSEDTEPDYSDIIALMKWDQIRGGHDCFIGAAALPSLAWLASFGLLLGLIRRR
ncbi:MAG: hypothetical protein BWY87_00792 [Deltaproteobacteria bacterium ADurb.Bin510]|nr:MAG: hypothetical protein BWY87_00792 [Deltaproteobacteria bacterium ADurb.Bin510]